MDEPAKSTAISSSLPDVSKMGGRERLPHQIDWHARAQQVWKRFPKSHTTIGKLIGAAAAASTDVIGNDEAARLKFSGRRTASDAFAKAMFDATGFSGFGLSFQDWMGDDAAWARAVDGLPEFDPRVLLDSLAEHSTLQMGIDSTPHLLPVRMRRAESGPPPEQRVYLNEYFVLHLRDLSSSPVSPAHLLLLEWSDDSQDWQVTNGLPGCRLDPRKTWEMTTRSEGEATIIHLGVRVAPPRYEFDLYLLAQRVEFDHRALAMIDTLGDKALMSQYDMAKLLEYLSKIDRGLIVTKIRYAVQ